MIDTKFITTLKTLNRQELKEFELFLKSPWCNTNKNVIQLISKIKNYHPHYDTPKMDKEKLFKRILPNGKFSDRRMNNILSEGYLILREFLVMQSFREDRPAKQYRLIQEFQNRNLETPFFKTSQAEIKRLEDKDVKEWEEHLELLQLHRGIYHYPNLNPRSELIELAIVSSDKYSYLVFLLERAAILVEKIFRNRVLQNVNYEIEPALKQWHIVSKGINHPAIELYRMWFIYNKENKFEQYIEVRNFFLNNFEKLNTTNQKILFITLKNDTVKLIRARHFDITELLPFYKLGLKTEILLNNGILSHGNFSSIIAASNTKKDFNFTSEVITIYSKRLDIKIQKEAISWAKAHTFYYQKELNQCLEILLNTQFNHQYFLQISKMLTTQAYFDLFLLDESYVDYLFSYFDSFEKWLQREKNQSKNIKKGYLRFVQICRIVAKFYKDIDFKSEKIQNLLANELNIQGAEWLGRKIDFILNQKKKKSSKF